MAKNSEASEELADEQTNEVEKPQSVRDSIIAARDEVEEKAGNDEVDTGKRAKEADDREQPKAKRTDKKEQSDADTDDKVLRTEKETESTESSTEEVEGKPTEKKVATKAPVGWTKEAKAKWNDLPPEIQESVLKREKEVSDGFAGTKQAQERLSKYDAVIQPRLKQIQEFGVSPEQTIDRLFQWMEILAHPDEATRHNGFKMLADNFKINLGKFAPQQPTDQGTTEQTTQTDAIPSWAQSLTAKQQEIENRIASQAQEQQQREAIQRQESSKSYIDNWVAQSKAVHFDRVRAVMHGLITSGAVPMKANGELDLDTAYAKAIRMDDELWDEVQTEKAEAKQREANDAAAKKKAATDKARNAGTSLRPSAPSAINNGLNGSRSSTAKTKNVTAAQSIRDAIREVSER